MRTVFLIAILCSVYTTPASEPAVSAPAAHTPAGNLQLVSRHADVAGMVVKSIEGKPMHGELVLRPMLSGEHMTLLELHYEAGTKAPLHTHSHESLIYVV